MDEATVELGETIATLQEHHFAMARQMYPHGTTLECEKCNRRRTITVGEFASILGHRWPTCCGQTLHLADADETIPLNRESISMFRESIPQTTATERKFSCERC